MFENLTPRILIVSPESDMLARIVEKFTLQGFDVSHTDSTEEALIRLQSEFITMLIIDSHLPGTSPLAVCESARVYFENLPIIMLSKPLGSHEKIELLKHGVDDIVQKPMNEELLYLKAKVLLKYSLMGSNVKTTNQLTINGCTIDLITGESETPTKKFKLTPKELKLLKLLILKKNQPVSREHILHYVWGYDVYPETRTVDNFIMALRKRFEENPSHPKFIKSIRGVGYSFVG